MDAVIFSERYGEIYVDLYKFALCMMKHRQDAEDAVSEAVVSAYEHRNQLRSEDAFKPWMFRILANVCKKRLCAQSSSRETLTGEPDEETGGSTEMEDVAAREDVRRALAVLSDEERMVVSLSVHGDYTSREIGEAMELNENTVRSKRKRAFEKMRWLLQS